MIVPRHFLTKHALYVLMLAFFTLTGCCEKNCTKPSEVPRQFTILAINDIYNIEGVDEQKRAGLARVRNLRQQLSQPGKPVLLLHAGDFLYPSLLSRMYKGEQMIDMLNLLDGKQAEFDERFFITFGNHEFDKKEPADGDALAQRIAESEFIWLNSNVKLKDDISKQRPQLAKNLLPHALIDIDGIKVGLFSLTTNIATANYVTIDDAYAVVAKAQINLLKKQGAQVIIALTHLNIEQDLALLDALGENGPDVIFGGHEHNRLFSCKGKRCVIKSDAEGRSATIATISLNGKGEVNVNSRFEMLGDTINPDPVLKARADQWLEKHENAFCKNIAKGCLGEVFAKAGVELVAEELELRRYETNFGSYLADRMVSAFDNIKLPDGRKVQIALVNSGSFRLNQNIPAGANITRRHLEGIFQYDTKIRLLEMNGATLKKVLRHSVSKWTGMGWWLQVSGIAFRHNTQTGEVSQVSMLQGGKWIEISDDQKIVAAVSDFIANPMINGNKSDQDGYTMLNLGMEIKYPGELMGLRKEVEAAIRAEHAKNMPIAPPLPGRICSSDRPTVKCVLD